VNNHHAYRPHGRRRGDNAWKHHDDFSEKKGAQEPRIPPVTPRLDNDPVAHFNEMVEEAGIPYQTLITSISAPAPSTSAKLEMLWAS
jgi:hypothetical protein